MQKKLIIKLSILIIFIVIFIVLSIIYVNTFFIDKKCIDKYLDFNNINNKDIFSISKITYFSNCNADISTNSNSSFTINDLYQYTDIAIYIDNRSDENTENLNAENTLKKVTLSDINFSLTPTIGKPNLYYKNVNDFAKPTFDTNNIINNELSFETTSELELDYSKPILYNNCANPITLCYVNSDIKKSYTLQDNISDLSHNGALLKSCGITLNSISSELSFNVNITNNLDEIYTCPLTLTIPLSTESSTLYDGTLTLKDTTNYTFIKTQ